MNVVIIMSVTIASAALIWSVYRLSACIETFSDVLSEYINKKENNVRDTSREEPSIGAREPQAEPNMESENRNRLEAGVKPEDFTDLVSKGTRTAVSFGEDVED